MIYVDADPVEWAKKYDIVPQEIECPKCHKKLIPNVPIRIRGYAGLELSPHGCDIKLAAVFVPITEEDKDFWKGKLYGTN